MPSIDQKIQEKISEIEKVSSDIPSVIILHDIRTMSVVYMSERGLQILNTTIEELKEMGPEYFNYYFHPDDAKTTADKIFEMIGKNNTYDVFTMFQRVRISGKNEPAEWQMYLTSIKILLKDENDNPVLTIAGAHPIQDETSVNGKVNRILEENTFYRSNKHLYETLSEREIQILKKIGQGASNEDIARCLFISIETVKTHRKNLKKKLNVSHSQELLQYAKAFDLV
jgi:DNA-binding CsgD family transcriptional regulator